MSPARPLPYGIRDLETEVQIAPGPPLRVKCYVEGCTQFLQPPGRGRRGEVCPHHGIRCHYSGGGRTYSYVDARRNVIIDDSLFAERVVGNAGKYESHRLGQEKSEDALTWNVFRSLQAAGLLQQYARRITGLDIPQEPVLYLWGLCSTDDTFAPWDLLQKARVRFESQLPVRRPPTEPDIALHLPGRYLLLIEAKFTSPNPAYANGPRGDAASLTKDELLRIYQDPALQILDGDRARHADQVHHQLWRNTVFAEWMALADEPTTQAYHANLTRSGFEVSSCEQFRKLLSPKHADRFSHLAWEEVYPFCMTEQPVLARLRQYLATKTAGLVRAFRIPSGSPDVPASDP